MTKKDYELIASVFAESSQLDKQVMGLHQNALAATAKQMADALAKVDPKFQKGNFLLGCGLTLHGSSDGTTYWD